MKEFNSQRWSNLGVPVTACETKEKLILYLVIFVSSFVLSYLCICSFLIAGQCFAHDKQIYPLWQQYPEAVIKLICLILFRENTRQEFLAWGIPLFFLFVWLRVIAYFICCRLLFWFKLTPKLLHAM